MSRNGGTLWDTAFDIACDYINQKAKGSNERELYAELMAADRWRNRDFNNLIDAIVAAGPEIDKQYYRKGDSEREVLKAAVVDIVDGHFASIVLADRKLSRDLPQRQYDDMKKAQDIFYDLCGNNRSRGRDRDDRDDRGRDRDRRDDRDDRSSSRCESFGERRDNRDDRSSSRDDRSSRRNNDDDTDSAWSVLASIGNVQEAELDPHEERDDGRDRQREEPPQRKARQEPEDPRRISDRPSVIQGPDHTRSDPYKDYWQDGEHWVVSHKSGWTLNDPECGDLGLVPGFYNINTHVKYHVKNEYGVVREELVEMTVDNRYLNHELRNSADVEEENRSLTAAFSFKPRPKATADSDVLDTEYSEMTNTTYSLAQLLTQIDPEELTLSEGRPVDSIAAGVFINRNKLMKSGNDISVSLSLLRTPVVTSSWEQTELLDEVYRSHNLTQASELLRELKPKFDPGLWDVVNQRYTHNVLRALRYQFQWTRINTMNFANHYDAVVNKLAEDKGAEFSAQFAARVRFINALSCGHLARDEMNAMTDDMVENADDVPGIVFVDFVAIVTLIGTLDELGLGAVLKNSPTGVSITSASQKSLTSSLRALYSRLDERLPAPAKVRVYLSTTDNRVVEVLPYATRLDSFILALVE